MRALRLTIAASASLLAGATAGAQVNVTLSNGQLPGGAAAPNFTFNTGNVVTNGTQAAPPAQLFSTGNGATNFHTADVSIGNAGDPGNGGTGLRGSSLMCKIEPASGACTGSITYRSFQGQNGFRGLIDLTFGGKSAVNGAGNDLFALEWSTNEGYMARFSSDDGATFSDWRYNPASIYYHSLPGQTDQYFTWLTLYDFSDFGFAAGTSINRIQFQSVLAGDRGVANGGGTSFLFDNTASNPFLVNPQTGNPYTTSTPVGYTGSDLTADVWYVAATNDLVAVTATPEPATLALLGTGLLGLAAAARRRRRA